MALRLRILLWVSSLFLFTIFCIFIISHFEINYNLNKEENTLIAEVKRFDTINFDNIKKSLSISFNDQAEKLYHTYDSMRNSSQWRQRFLPTPYVLRTNSWGSSGALLATYPWLDFVNIEVNQKPSAYIKQSSPFLRKYVKIPIAEDLVLFTTKLDDGSMGICVGVPFWSNKSMLKYINDKVLPEFVLADKTDQWLLFEAKSLLTIDPSTLTIENNKIYTHLFDQAITIHSNEEFTFLINSLKTMLSVTIKKLNEHPELLTTLADTSKRDLFIKSSLEKIKPNLSYQRNYCVGPLCNYETMLSESNWSTRRNFEHRITQKKLIWEMCMLIRTGAFDFTPFTDKSPIGIVTALDLTYGSEPNFYDHVTEGVFTSDVFLKEPLTVPMECTLEVKNAAYDRFILFGGKDNGKATSCINKNLKIFYDEKLKEPYLTSTHFITYLDSTMKTPNTSAITLGVSLDPILINLALVSPDEVVFIYKDKDMRLYKTNGEIYTISKDSQDYDQTLLLTQNEGTIEGKDGHKLFFKRLGNITETDGTIVLIEKQESRSDIIKAINDHVNALSKKVTIHSAILITLALIIMIVILNKVLNAITKPINELALLTGKISERSLSDIRIDQTVMNRKDEIGTLYTSFSAMIKSMQEGNKVRGLLDKVVSKQIAAKIVKEGIKLGGEIRNITVMFCDIRNFTAITEKMNPQDVIIMLNECLTLLSAVIDDFEGVIDKYEGDKIMTLFGAPLDNEFHELQAVLCAIEMQQALFLWNETRARSGFCKLEVGIGLHTGEAVAGNVGAENHLSYTVLGHIVNLSARLCDSAAAREILVTKETLEGIKDHVEFRENPPRQFKGISSPIVTYSILRKK